MNFSLLDIVLLHCFLPAVVKVARVQGIQKTLKTGSLIFHYLPIIRQSVLTGCLLSNFKANDTLTFLHVYLLQLILD